MKYFELGKTGLQVSNIAMGCMRITGRTKEEVARLIETAVEEGVNFSIMRTFMAVITPAKLISRNLLH